MAKADNKMGHINFCEDINVCSIKDNIIDLKYTYDKYYNTTMKTQSGRQLWCVDHRSYSYTDKDFWWTHYLGMDQRLEQCSVCTLVEYIFLFIYCIMSVCVYESGCNGIINSPYSKGLTMQLFWGTLSLPHHKAPRGTRSDYGVMKCLEKLVLLHIKDQPVWTSTSLNSLPTDQQIPPALRTAFKHLEINKNLQEGGVCWLHLRIYYNYPPEASWQTQQTTTLCK